MTANQPVRYTVRARDDGYAIEDPRSGQLFGCYKRRSAALDVLRRINRIALELDQFIQGYLRDLEG